MYTKDIFSEYNTCQLMASVCTFFCSDILIACAFAFEIYFQDTWILYSDLHRQDGSAHLEETMRPGDLHFNLLVNQLIFPPPQPPVIFSCPEMCRQMFL